MEVIFATDAIFPPLTGIGRYASELASRLPAHADIERLHYLGMWMWRGQALPAAVPGESAEKSAGMSAAPTVSPLVARARRYFADRRWAVSVYDRVAERWRARLLAAQGRRPQPPLYHSPNFFLPPYAGPSVVTVHDLSIDRFPETHLPAQRHYFSLAFARSLARADAVITVSNSVREELIADYGMAADKVFAVHHGVDACFHPRAEAELVAPLQAVGLKPGGYVLAVSTLEPRKRLEQLILAYRQLTPAQRQRWPLVLVGARGWRNEKLMADIAAAQAEGWLHRLGYVPQALLPALYAGARGLAMVSIYEGFGLPLLEAMASGVPVLTANRSCMPEVTAGAALLADPDDVNDIAAQLRRLLEDEPWRAAAIAAGRARAAELSWERCIKRTVDVYRQVLTARA